MGGVTLSVPFVQVGFALHIHRLDIKYIHHPYFLQVSLLFGLLILIVAYFMRQLRIHLENLKE